MGFARSPYRPFNMSNGHTSPLPRPTSNCSAPLRSDTRRYSSDVNIDEAPVALEIRWLCKVLLRKEIKKDDDIEKDVKMKKIKLASDV